MKKRILDVLREGNSYYLTDVQNTDILVSLKNSVSYDFLKSLSLFKQKTKQKKYTFCKYNK